MEMDLVMDLAMDLEMDWIKDMYGGLRHLRIANLMSLVHVSSHDLLHLTAQQAVYT